ncbi:hypothetical protein C9994_11450 [Marivirga lumbricoides]|uniref:Lipocalin-like domain-containing protein n=1 Tax=Marivirga lumbricoides TaxID=1046115 RepID=A0A2T4DNA1_9BACT|nr:hypothetical protein C9994_11450 [Marivirga lumbricoides]
MKMQSIKEQIIGTWKFVSWVYTNEKNETVHYFEEGSEGVLMYDEAGNMNAQIMRPGRITFKSGAIAGGTKEETKEAFDSYLAYFGKYYETEPGKIIHKVEGALFPNWLGNEQIRYGEIVDDKLIIKTQPISAPYGEIVFTVTWKRK